MAHTQFAPAPYFAYPSPYHYPHPVAMAATHTPSPSMVAMPTQQTMKPEPAVKHENEDLQAANILLSCPKETTTDEQAAKILLSVSPKFGPAKPAAAPSPLDLLADFALDGPKPAATAPHSAMKKEVSTNLRALNLEIRTSTNIPDVLEQYKDIYNKDGRIGIYTRKERDAIIKRFQDKRTRRVWKKKIRYGCRKNLADRRIRVKGRFVRSCDQNEAAIKAAIVGYEKPPKGRRATM